MILLDYKKKVRFLGSRERNSYVEFRIQGSGFRASSAMKCQNSSTSHGSTIKKNYPLISCEGSTEP